MQDVGCRMRGWELTYLLRIPHPRPSNKKTLRLSSASGLQRFELVEPNLRPPGRNNNTDAADDADIDGRHVGQEGKHGENHGVQRFLDSINYARIAGSGQGVKLTADMQHQPPFSGRVRRSGFAVGNLLGESHDFPKGAAQAPPLNLD
jgi:hypothetical protein